MAHNRQLGSPPIMSTIDGAHERLENSEAPKDWPGLIGLPERLRQAIMMRCSEGVFIMNEANSEHDEAAMRALSMLNDRPSRCSGKIKVDML